MGEKSPGDLTPHHRYGSLMSMAKHRTLALSRPTSAAPIVVMAPSRGGKVRRAGRRVGAVARKVGRRAGSAARRQGAAHLPAIGVALGGLAVGYADAKGYLAKLPQIGGSRALTLGLLGYAATRFSKNQYVRMAGVAAIGAAAFDYGKVHGTQNTVPPKTATHGIEEPASPAGGPDDGPSGGDRGPY
jgi:hypothetical protein